MTAIAFASPTSPLADAPSEPAHIEMIDPSTYFDVAGFAWSDGDTASARRALSDGGAVLLPAQTAQHLKVHRGGTVRVATSTGPRRFKIAGTYVSLVSGPGIVVGTRDGQALLAMGKPTEVDVRAVNGTSATALQRSITKRAGGNADFGFSTAQQLAVNVRMGLSRATHLYDSVLFVCLLVSMLGLGNTLAMSVFERRREVGVLRAIGTARAGIARMVMAESVTLVLVALVLALPLGAAVASITISSIAGTFGFPAQFVYPWGTVPSLAVLAGAVALIAALFPARRAARLDVIDALHLD